MLRKRGHSAGVESNSHPQQLYPLIHLQRHYHRHAPLILNFITLATMKMVTEAAMTVALEVEKGRKGIQGRRRERVKQKEEEKRARVLPSTPD